MTCSFSKEFSISAFTDVENAFITEYLPVSSGNAVKVYLYGLFLCQHPEQDKSLQEISSMLIILPRKSCLCDYITQLCRLQYKKRQGVPAAFAYLFSFFSLALASSTVSPSLVR